MNDYNIVYDYSEETMNFDWLLGVVFILAGFGITYYQYKTKGKITAYKGIFGICFMGVATLWTVWVGYIQFSGYIQAHKIIKQKTYTVVEGDIGNFDPMPASGHKHESFTVQGVRFEYSDFEIVEGFNNTKSHGGPIRGNGQKVRITYYTVRDRNLILKLEIRNSANTAYINHRAAKAEC
jgi:hypothetical protein